MVVNTPKLSLSLGTESDVGLSEQRALLIMPYSVAEYKKDVDINLLPDSHLKNMLLKFRELNKFTKLSYIGVVATGTPTNATATITINSGVAFATSIEIFLLDTTSLISIPANSSIEVISGLIATSLIANKYVENVDISVDFITLTITLNDLLIGDLGNNIYFNTNTTLLTFGNFTGGSFVADYDLDLITDDRYQNIILSNVFNGKKLADFMKARFNNDYVLLDGIAIKHYQNKGEVDIDLIDNNQCMVQLISSKTKENYDAHSVIFGALRSLRFTDGANLTQLVDASAGVSNNVGGINMSSIPYHNTNLNKYIELNGEVYSMQETLDFEAKRLTLIDYDLSGYNVLINDVFTSYKIDEAGNDDNTYKFLNNVDIALNVRELFFNKIKAKTKQSTLATGGKAISNRGQLSVESVKTGLLSVYQDLIALGIVEDELNFKKNLFVNFDKQNQLIQLQYYIYPIQALRSIVGKLIVKI